jgi:prepilin-type N-terminal cleavage/methylation domain-containing protein/prepilin-type processing-associated H-X9-DG protein
LAAAVCMIVSNSVRRSNGSPAGEQVRGFTLVELLVVMGIIAILAGLLLSALVRSKARAYGIFCLNNTRQLTLAWIIYADDHDGRLAYNLGGDASRKTGKTVAPFNNLNWVNGIMDWELSADNTNTALIAEASLGPYANKVVSIYKCPADRVLSEPQRRAGWKQRARSYSMNAMVGDAGEISQLGFNANNPEYVQFFKFSSIPNPARIFVFLDEHPDSINDGYFLNRDYYLEWIDLPASYHNGAGSFSFADGHSEIHRWRYPRTKQPAEPDATTLPLSIPINQSADFYWTLDRMSVER